MLEKVIYPSPSSSPIMLGDFEKSLHKLTGPFDGSKRFAVAVSGGSDSMALLHLMHQLSKVEALEITVLTVDHDLRPDAAIEAKAVQNWCINQGIPHYILRWEHQGVTSRMQERARQARYKLLINWCKTHDTPFLLTAHHHEDQLETTTMRLLKGSGLRGLAGMSACRALEGIYHLRPLLNVHKQSLQDLVLNEKIPYFEDPSNHHPRFDRGRLRLSQTQITPLIEPIQKTCARFRPLYEKHIDRLLTNHFHRHPLGFATLDLSITQALPETFLKDLLTILFQNIRHDQNPPSGKSIERLACAMQKQTQYAGTLAGFMILKHQRYWYFIFKESTLPHPFFVTTTPWQAIGEKGWQTLCTQDPSIKDLPFPKKALMASLAPLEDGKINLNKSMVKQFHGQKDPKLQKNLLFLPFKAISSFIFVENS